MSYRKPREYKKEDYSQIAELISPIVRTLASTNSDLNSAAAQIEEGTFTILFSHGSPVDNLLNSSCSLVSFGGTDEYDSDHGLKLMTDFRAEPAAFRDAFDKCIPQLPINTIGTTA
jgi:hypothetical protein